MNHIAVCDDDRDTLMYIKNCIYTYFHGRREEVEVSCFSDTDSFLRSYSRGSYFIVFLDIDMEPFDGLTLANKIWSIDKKTIIVFETGHEEYSRAAYGVHPFDYIVKPFGQEQINKVFDDYFGIKSQNPSSDFFEYNNKKINIDSIIYIEKVLKRNKVLFITDDGKEELYISLEKILEKLNINPNLNGNFIRCHKGFIVNIDKVLSYDGNECNMGVGTPVQVGKKFKNNFEQAYIRHIKKYKRV